MLGTMLTQLSKQRAADPADLVELLSECHLRIRSFTALAHRAATANASATEISQACVDVERYFTQALPLHIADEEDSIEPRLRGLSPPIDDALDAMSAQHQRHTSAVQTLLNATNEVRRTPLDAAARARLAYAAHKLKTEFDEHLALEESVIFPAIRQLLSQATQSTLMGELRDRRRQR